MFLQDLLLEKVQLLRRLQTYTVMNASQLSAHVPVRVGGGSSSWGNSVYFSIRKKSFKWCSLAAEPHHNDKNILMLISCGVIINYLFTDSSLLRCADLVCRTSSSNNEEHQCQHRQAPTRRGHDSPVKAPSSRYSGLNSK